MPTKLDLFREDVKVGDEVVLFLTTGREVRGPVTEIAESYVKLETAHGTSSRFFEKMLEGWEVVPKSTHPSTERTGDNAHVHVPPSLPLPAASAEPRPELPSGITPPSLTEAVRPLPIGPERALIAVEEAQPREPPIKPVDTPREKQGAVAFPASEAATDNNNGVSPRQEQGDDSLPAVPTETSSTPPEAIQEPVSKPPALEVLSALFKIEAQLEARMATARLEPQPPSFEFPDKDIPSQGSTTARQLWNQVSNRYAHARKINELDPKFGRIQPIVKDLRQLVSQYSKSVVLKRHLAVCLGLANNGPEALAVAIEAARLADSAPDDWLNLAALAVRQNAEELACLALEQVFRQRPAREHETAWYLFLRLAHKFGNYVPLPSLFDATREPQAGEADDLLTQAAVFLLKATRGETAAADALQACRRGAGSRATVCEALAELPTESNPQYRKVVEDWVWESRAAETPQERPSPMATIPDRPAERVGLTPFQSQVQGHIVRYNRDKSYGFIDDGSNYSKRWASHFFHRSAVIDDRLLQQLQDDTWSDLPVVFQSAEGPRGKVALQISQQRAPREALDLARGYADQGEYAQAIAQVRPLLDQSDFPEARELHERWREFARLTAVPKGSNPYARARRLQLIEKEFDGAVELFGKAIQTGDNAESAIKDLESVR